MSWSKGAVTGTPAHVIEHAEAWASQQEAVDKTWAGEVVTKAHKDQIGRCVEAIKEFAGHIPEGYHMSASANGHANQDGTGQYNVQVGAYKPVPNVAAETKVIGG